MRALSPIFSFLVWLVAFAVGVALLTGGLYPRLLSDFVPGFLYQYGVQQSFQVGSGLVGGVLVLMVVLRVGFVLSRGERRERSISFASSLGEINVSLDTIEAFLARGGSTLPEVERLAVHLTPLEDRKSVRVDVAASVFHGRNIRELCEGIARYIADSTRAVLGIEEIGDVNVSVKKVIGEPRTGADRYE
jgi:hypothetical protein